MIAFLEALEPFIPVGILGLILLIAIFVAKSAKEMDITLPGGSSIRSRSAGGTGSLEARVTAARIDLEQYGEVAAALEGLVDASPEQVEAAARQWFSQLATRLALRLKEERDQHYRVAIWLDDPNYPDRFLGIGRGLFDHADSDMDSLDRRYTIGGLAFESVTMTYYCRDRRTDPQFKPRKNVPPSFQSVFGLALGDETNRWGVMTVDARQANGFPDDAQWMIRQFGELASLGAFIWYSRVTPAGPTAGT